ncbi:ADA HAT complex component 1 [Microdochium nivale]|nr:ADA HAT complex component 1 [Microdochium nivale]
MLMFRFWSSDSGKNDRTCHADQPMFELGKTPVQSQATPDLALPLSPTSSQAQGSSNVAITPPPAAEPHVLKRQRPDDDDALTESRPLKKVMATPPAEADDGSSVSTVSAGASLAHADMERATEVIEAQMSLEILLKHDELRLINQELAKCQVALEQLRRCHLIPYPVNIPTPEQMLRIAGGSGPALTPKPGVKLPQWAPPFGVTDGPYARHYAKWLIPDPKFDGMPAPTLVQSDPVRLSAAQDGRSTRNSFVEQSSSKGRPVRGNAGQKLQALSSGYAPPKSQQGPCVLKRADGKTVKLVCIDCQRENFNSTQGFINHCRIAHKRDFKSHEEAAVHCGHPLDIPDVSTSSAPTEEKRTVAPPPPMLPSGLVHPFSRANGMSDSEACLSVVNRIQQSMDGFRKGSYKPTGVHAIPGVSRRKQNSLSSTKSQAKFSPAASSPHLSRLLQSRGFNGHLDELVADAKIKVDLNEVAYEDDDDDEDTPMADARKAGGQARAPATKMRVPASSTTKNTRPGSSKGTMHPTSQFATPLATPLPRLSLSEAPEMVVGEELMAPELSPSTAISNNAPSLVSDDSDYDDSEADSDSRSETNDAMDTRSISDVDEIDIDEEHTRHHHQGAEGARSAVRLRKDEAKHVSFINPVQNESTKEQKRP